MSVIPQEYQAWREDAYEQLEEHIQELMDNWGDDLDYILKIVRQDMDDETPIQKYERIRGK